MVPAHDGQECIQGKGKGTAEVVHQAEGTQGSGFIASCQVLPCGHCSCVLTFFDTLYQQLTQEC